MSGLGHNRKSSVSLGMSAFGGRADELKAKADITRQRSPCLPAPLLHSHLSLSGGVRPCQILPRRS